MNCKRCGAECSAEDKFCRSCGKRFPRPPRASKPKDLTVTAETEAETDESAELYQTAEPMNKKRKLMIILVSALMALLILVGLFFIFLPRLKQTFMTPAAYYLESESKELRAFSADLHALSEPFYKTDAGKQSGTLQIEAEGDAFENLQPVMQDLTLRTSYKTDAKNRTSLSVDLSYEEEIFCRLLASLSEDRLALSFPELTKGEVVARFSEVLSKTLKSDDGTLSALTGFDRKELTEWIVSYLKPLLSEALEQSEQTLDFAVVDGNEVSTVTFHLTEKQVKDLLRSFASQLRRDTKPVTILRNLSGYLYESEEFRRELKSEFNLSDEDLDALPILDTIRDLFPEEDDPEEGSLAAFLATRHSEEECAAYTEKIADTIADFSDTFKTDTGIALTAYYQGSELIGRSLKQGTQTLFECFRYQRDAEKDLEIRFEKDDLIYHFLHTDSSDSATARHTVLLTTRPADAEDAAESTEKTLFSFELEAEKNAAVGGVHTFIGRATLLIDNLTVQIQNERDTHAQTRLTVERKVFDTDLSLASRVKLRGQMQYSSDAELSDFRVPASSDFGKPAFRELTLNLQRNLQDHPAFETYFGDGSLSRFLAEEEERAKAAALEDPQDEEGEEDAKKADKPPLSEQQEKRA